MRAWPLPDRPCAAPLLGNTAQRSTKKSTVPGNIRQWQMELKESDVFLL